MLSLFVPPLPYIKMYVCIKRSGLSVTIWSLLSVGVELTVDVLAARSKGGKGGSVKVDPPDGLTGFVGSRYCRDPSVRRELYP